jgi:hypothetical protein
MTVLRHIDDHRLLPSKQEISNHRAENDSNTKPGIVGHEDQHQHQRQRNLNEVQEALIEMHQREDRWPKKEIKNQLNFIELSDTDLRQHAVLGGELKEGKFRWQRLHALLVIRANDIEIGKLTDFDGRLHRPC